MGKEKKKFQSGTATSFISRPSAVKRLQLSLIDFRRLCILKGIYPVQPNSLKKAGKGSKVTKTYYRYKDIQFLAHEPIINKFRAHKVYTRKLKNARVKKEKLRKQILQENEPTYRVDHIVKERYPSFVDAIRDLDDPLALCSLFCTLRRNAKIRNVELIPLCRRLVVEFMNYVITERALRKVFLSIKGIYYQVDIQGQPVTWIVPYAFSYSQPGTVDLKIMSTFADFYTTLLGFINFRLYHSINLHYPPKVALNPADAKAKGSTSYSLKDQEEEEKVSSFAHDLVKAKPMQELDEEGIDEDQELIGGGDLDEEQRQKLRDDEEKLKKLKKLFENCKFFLSREVPRESLTFVIRCFGGSVSWDKVLYIGATYDISNETITHQIVDRPQPDRQYLSRYYIQPQWVYDCVNARMLLPVEDYFPGTVLPPHLSPFVEEKEGEYVPPEKKALMDRQHGVQPSSKTEEEEGDDESSEDEGDKDAEENEDEEEEIIEESGEEDDDDDDDASSSGEDDQQDEGEEKTIREAEKKRLKELKVEEDKSTKEKSKKKRLSVEPGEVQVVDSEFEALKQAGMERRLQEMMIPKKRRWLYKRLMKKKKDTAKESRKLTQRRSDYEAEQKVKRKKQKASSK
ncbi:pescadillo homolog [Amphiura filiformis]|uniref:pescadillo homolog n=1 Tax=Amphiura filiformis TaxID=82378 RepID=UPI003B22051E